MIIAIDFDGTCVTHEFPLVGQDIGAAPVLKRLVEAGHKLILWTMRSDVENPRSDHPDGQYLTDAVNWFKERNIPLWGINSNPEQHTWTHSPKAYAQLYIDDAALGCPLAQRPLEISLPLGDVYWTTPSRPYVDWEVLEQMLIEKKIISH